MIGVLTMWSLFKKVTFWDTFLWPNLYDRTACIPNHERNIHFILVLLIGFILILFLSVHSSGKHLHQRAAKNVQKRCSLRCETTATEHSSVHLCLVSNCLYGREMQREFKPVAGFSHLKTSNQASSVKSDMIWYWKYKRRKKTADASLKRHILKWPDMSAEKYSLDWCILLCNSGCKYKKLAWFYIYISFDYLKDIVHSKINVLSLFTHPWQTVLPQKEITAKEQHEGGEIMTQ